MNNRFFLFFLFAILIGCDKEYEEPSYYDILDDYTIFCPEQPIEIMSNNDVEAHLLDETFLNYFSIVQLSDSLFYMYYEAFRGHAIDFEQTVSFAYSNNGIEWIRGFPNSQGEDNTIIASNITGVSVTMVDDKFFPFRLFGYCKKNNGYALFMWKSKDGLSFTNKKEILSGEFDTQTVGVAKDQLIKLYTRTKEDGGRNRKIAIFYIDFEGNVITTPKVLIDNYVYNSAATCFSDKYDLLLPTKFSSEVSGNDEAYIETLIVDGYSSKRINNNINYWIFESFPWALVSPGFLTINGEKYIAYLTRSWSHDSCRPNDGVSKYYLLKVTVE